MTKYLKIETPFERAADGSKKLIKGKFRNETVEYLANSEWVFTEKIDGTNIGIVWDGHKVTYQGRTENAQIPAHLANKLVELFGGNSNEELFEQKFGEVPVILFGEGYGVKINGGGAYRPDVSFILFDVYLPLGGVWMKRKSVEDIARFFNIDVVPIIMRGTIKQAVDYVKTKPVSTIGTAKMEGLVGRPAVELNDRMGRRVITKIKAVDFE